MTYVFWLLVALARDIAERTWMRVRRRRRDPPADIDAVITGDRLKLPDGSWQDRAPPAQPNNPDALIDEVLDAAIADIEALFAEDDARRDAERAAARDAENDDEDSDLLEPSALLAFDQGISAKNYRLN